MKSNLPTFNEYYIQGQDEHMNIKKLKVVGVEQNSLCLTTFIVQLKILNPMTEIS